VSLKVELKPHERLIIGSCVVTNSDQRTRLFIDGSAPIRILVHERREAIEICRGAGLELCLASGKQRVAQSEHQPAISRPCLQDFELTLRPDWEPLGLLEYVCEENNRCAGGKCRSSENP